MGELADNLDVQRNEIAKDFIKVFMRHGIMLSMKDALKLADVGIKAIEKVE